MATNDSTQARAEFKAQISQHDFPVRKNCGSGSEGAVALNRNLKTMMRQAYQRRKGREAGFNQAVLAGEIGWNASKVSRYLNPHSSQSVLVADLVVLCRALDCNTSELLWGAQDLSLPHATLAILCRRLTEGQVKTLLAFMGAPMENIYTAYKHEINRSVQ